MSTRVDAAQKVRKALMRAAQRASRNGWRLDLSAAAVYRGRVDRWAASRGNKLPGGPAAATRSLIVLRASCVGIIGSGYGAPGVVRRGKRQAEQRQ